MLQAALDVNLLKPGGEAWGHTRTPPGRLRLRLRFAPTVDLLEISTVAGGLFTHSPIHASIPSACHRAGFCLHTDYETTANTPLIIVAPCHAIPETTVNDSSAAQHALWLQPL